MHLRTARFVGVPDDLERTISAFDRLSAPVRRQPGCEAIALLTDHRAGRAVVATYWQTEAAMNRSEQAATEASGHMIAEHALRMVGIERHEVILLEQDRPLQAGTFVRLVAGHGAPHRIAHARRVVWERVLPVISVQRGFRSVVAAVNRHNGRLVVGSCWETAADGDASVPHLAPARRQLTEEVAAAAPLRVESYEVAFAETRVPLATAC